MIINKYKLKLILKNLANNDLYSISQNIKNESALTVSNQLSSLKNTILTTSFDNAIMNWDQHENYENFKNVPKETSISNIAVLSKDLVAYPDNESLVIYNFNNHTLIKTIPLEKQIYRVTKLNELEILVNTGKSILKVNYMTNEIATVLNGNAFFISTINDKLIF